MQEENTGGSRRKSSVDQEVLVLKRLEEYTALVSRLQGLSKDFVGAAQPMVHGAIQGATQNLVVEIMRTLGVEPAFVNLGRLQFDWHGSLGSLHHDGGGER